MNPAPSVLEAYKDPTWLYDIRGFFILTFAYRDTLWGQIGFFSKNMAKQHAEIAIGSGTLLSLILLWRRWTRKASVEIEASDYVPSMLRSAARRFKKSPHVHIITADAMNLPYHSESFDTINIANSFHCFHNPESVLIEMKRVLKPGGTLACNILLYPRKQHILDRIAAAINNWGMKKGILVTPYNEGEIHALFTKTELSIVYAQRQGNCLYVLAKRA